jgi:2-iminoacetate synthase
VCSLAVITKSSEAVDFIDEPRLSGLLKGPRPEASAVRDVIAKSMELQALSLEETAVLLRTDDRELIEETFEAARALKRKVYGNRIVLFAPLYIGNECVNDCVYCAFRKSNQAAQRRTLSDAEIAQEVGAMENMGHKRLIIVFGEHPLYDADFISRCVRQVYAVKVGRGEIRRVNVNAAPLDEKGFAAVKASGIGTYQIFQETYHHATYARMHGAGTRKGDYLWRLSAMDRAMRAGVDDVGIGALFGLADWRFEVLGLIAHAAYLQGRFGVGPHTISFPRIQPACGVRADELDQPGAGEASRRVSDYDFKRLIAALRLAVPYTGMICTARENADIRRAVLDFGVSQIDAGSRVELGGYTQAGKEQVLEREQFALGDLRPLEEVVRELLRTGHIPSWCTSCYRLGRTGEHFMEFAIPGFIQNFCTPNALTTLMEYLVDYANPQTRAEGEKLIAAELAKLKDGPRKKDLLERLRRVKDAGERDLYF